MLDDSHNDFSQKTRTIHVCMFACIFVLTLNIYVNMSPFHIYDVNNIHILSKLIKSGNYF